MTKVGGPTGPDEFSSQPPWLSKAVGGGGVLWEEALRRPNGWAAGRTERAEQVESHYTIASIKPLAVVKVSAFQRLYFLLSL